MNYQWKIECFLEDLFLGGQSSIILGYRRLSVKSLLVCDLVLCFNTVDRQGLEENPSLALPVIGYSFVLWPNDTRARWEHKDRAGIISLTNGNSM